MPAPGAAPVERYDALDLGRGDDGIWRIATRYSDGSYVIWNGEGANEELAYIEPGRSDPVDIGGGRAAVVNPDMSVTAYSIANPPPQFQGAPQGGAPGAPLVAPASPAAPGAPGAALGQPVVGAGRYPAGFGTTVSAATRNPASPGRNAGWGSLGAGTEAQQYGYGVPGFGQAPIKINEVDLPYLFDPKLAPGYIPGSGTYNQYRLDAPSNQWGAQYGGLFGPVGPQHTVVNTHYGLGGPGDPTTGGEVQTPQRWITGNAQDSAQAMQGDAAWRARYGGGGGGFDPALAGAMPAYAYAGGGGGGVASQAAIPAGTAAGGMGGGFFGSTVTSNWGQTAETAGKDYLATLFLRSDTPTGVGTPAWSAPDAMWQGLLEEIRAGRIYVQDPQAWQMIQEKTGATPQTIGGAALGGQNVQPGGVAGQGAGQGSTEDAIANANAAAAADKAAYWAYQQSLLRQGDQRIALEDARDAWSKTYQTAGLTGQFGGQDTMAMQQQKYAQDLANRQFGLSEAGVTGTYGGQKTQQAIAQENAAAQALLGLQASLQGPRNWARYQSTFGATPQGLQDVMAAYQGRYQLPTGQGAQNAAQGGRQSVAGLGGDILSGTYGNDGTTTQPLGNPRQADLQNYARMQPSQREMILGQYENEGWYGPDVENLLKGAAPRAPGASGAQYNFLAR